MSSTSCHVCELLRTERLPRRRYDTLACVHHLQPDWYHRCRILNSDVTLYRSHIYTRIASLPTPLPENPVQTAPHGPAQQLSTDPAEIAEWVHPGRDLVGPTLPGVPVSVATRSGSSDYLLYGGSGMYLRETEGVRQIEDERQNDDGKESSIVGSKRFDQSSAMTDLSYGRACLRDVEL